MMRCSVCYHNAAVSRGLCSECLVVVYAHDPANSVIQHNRDPLGIRQPVLSGVSADGSSNIVPVG